MLRLSRTRRNDPINEADHISRRFGGRETPKIDQDFVLSVGFVASRGCPWSARHKKYISDHFGRQPCPLSSICPREFHFQNGTVVE